MVRIIFIFALVFTMIKSVSAEIVNQIVINGNKRVSNETIMVYGEIKKNANYSEIDLNRILKNFYSTDFFEDVEVNLKNNVLTVNLKEYPIVNQLVIVGEKSNSLKKQIKETLQLKEKRSFIKSYLAKDVEKIKNLYSSIGYSFAKVEIKQKKIDENKFDLVLTITRGEQLKITSINFIGNNAVKSRRLRDVIASEENKFWKIFTKNTNLNEDLINLDRRLLTNYYKSLGFYDIKINSNFAEISKSGDAKLIFSIDEGDRYIIKKISTKVDQALDKKVFLPLNKTYNDHIGEYYSPFKIKKLLEEIDEIIENNNLQFIEHNVEEIIETNGINIIFNIYEGEKVLVERINIKGNNVTNENVIRGNYC